MISETAHVLHVWTVRCAVGLTLTLWAFSWEFSISCQNCLSGELYEFFLIALKLAVDCFQVVSSPFVIVFRSAVMDSCVV
jgi:hypothetical protein